MWALMTRNNGKKPLKSMASWNLSDGGSLDYVHRSSGFSRADHTFMLHNEDGHLLSKLEMNRDGSINTVETNPKHRRQGHATKLFNLVKSISDTYEDVPMPKHSNARTTAGDAWAKATGEEVPDMSSKVSASQFKGVDWKYIND